MITDYVKVRLSNGMWAGRCNLCGRDKVSAESGMIDGWMAAHQGADPSMPGDCPGLMRGAA